VSIWTDYRTRLPCPHAYADLQGCRGVCPKREDHRNTLGQQKAYIKQLFAAAMDDPDGKGAIVDVTHIAPFTHESTQIPDNSKIFAAAESYKKNKYQAGGLCIRECCY